MRMSMRMCIDDAHAHARAHVHVPLRAESPRFRSDPGGPRAPALRQLCALQGKLPAQGSRQVAFATAPRDLRLQWWDEPTTHPTFNCCDEDTFSVGDVYIAEAAVAFMLCSNRARLFQLAAGEFFECVLDEQAYAKLARKLTSW